MKKEAFVYVKRHGDEEEAIGLLWRLMEFEFDDRRLNFFLSDLVAMSEIENSSAEIRRRHCFGSLLNDASGLTESVVGEQYLSKTCLIIFFKTVYNFCVW